MQLRPSSFTPPAVLELDGVKQIAPRQRLKAGHLVFVAYQRTSENPYVTFPKFYRGSYVFARVVGEHSESDLVRVRYLMRYGFNGSIDRHLGNDFVIPRRNCYLVHPDPDFYAPPTPGTEYQVILHERLLTTCFVPRSYGESSQRRMRDQIVSMYSTYNGVFRQRAVAALHNRLKTWVPAPTSYEMMVGRALGAVSYTRTSRGEVARSKVRTYREGRKRRGLELAGLLRKVNNDPVPANFNQLRTWLANTSNNLHSTTAASISSRIDRAAEEHGFYLSRACNHWHTERGTIVGVPPSQIAADTDTYDGHRYCPDCLARLMERRVIVRVLNQSGEVYLVHTHHVSTYDWSDGTRRTYREPPIIGAYHSSKQYLTKPLPDLMGKVRPTLRVGYELEFVREEGCVRSTTELAREMQERIDSVTKELLGGQRYSCFEQDGSVEFELVSGYGPMDIHRRVLLELLGDGYFAKWLRSHDGGKCGLHVHLDKPDYSLIHAAKLTQFYNAVDNETMLRSVARRLSPGGRYAKQLPDKLKSLKEVKRQWRDAKGYSNMRRARLRQAMKMINGDRYELVNWQNDNTAEVRAFRGSMRASTVIACLEFAYMSWFFTRDTPGNRLNTDAFLAYISTPTWGKDTQYLRKYLSGKGFDVRTTAPAPHPSHPHVDLSGGNLINEI